MGAYRRGLRLSPGEQLGGDDIDCGFAELNNLVDEVSAQQNFLYKETLTAAAQTGNITLGAGDWAALTPGVEIVSISCNSLPISPITTEQYNAIYSKTDTGIPQVYCYDGFSNIYLYQVATGQTISIETRDGVIAFADTDTNYTMPDGYKSMLIARLAVMVFPGTVPPKLLQDAKRASFLVGKPRPKILNVQRYTSGGLTGYRPNIINGAT